MGQAARGRQAGSLQRACQRLHPGVDAIVSIKHARAKLKWFKKIHSKRGEPGQEGEEMLLRQGVLHGNTIALHL